MYLSGKLEIDPSQVTSIKKIKETSFLSKFVDVLTFGQSSKKQETETFTAVSILERIYLGLRSINVDNMIRLSVDDYDFYLDDSGKEDDLEEAVMEFTSKIDPIESQLFNTIYLVMEHQENTIKYLIEIRIKRKHQVGEYPINIFVNGISSIFRRTSGDNIQSLKNKMQHVFSEQDTYEEFIKQHKNQFVDFLDKMSVSVRKHIEVDDIKIHNNIQIIRTKTTVSMETQIRHDRFTKPVYYGYYGFDDYFFYTWLWASMMYENNIYAHDFYLVDEVGHEIFFIGEDGFNAGDYGTLNPDVPFEPIVSSDIEYFPQSEFKDELESQGIDFSSEVKENEDGDEFDEGNPDF
jgi:hypothetical protein